MLNNMISSALGSEGDPDLVRVCLFLLEIPGAVALQEQCSTVHAVISIMYRDALRLGFALHHKAHPSATLNSPHYTLGLEIGDQQTKLNIVCVLWLCLFVCVGLSVYWLESGLLCVDETLGAGHDIPLPRALRAHFSLFSPFMCEIDCAICAIQMDELMLVPINRLTWPFSRFAPHSGGKGETSASRRRKFWTSISTHTSATRIPVRRLKRSWRRSAASQFPRWVVPI